MRVRIPQGGLLLFYCVALLGLLDHADASSASSGRRRRRKTPCSNGEPWMPWTPPFQIPVASDDLSMYNAWLNHPTLDVHSDLQWAQRIFWSGDQYIHPAVRTAVAELSSWFPSTDVLKYEEGEPSAGSIILGTCSDSAVMRALAEGSACPAGGHEAFALRMTDDQQLLIVGGGPAGILYGAFAIIRHNQLGKPWTPAAVNVDQRPASALRLINHWNGWRGFPEDACFGPRINSSVGARWDSIFSWDDMRKGGNATKKVRDWVRLLASVGINAIAPQDVNWSERNNYLKHLDDVATFAGILREYAVKLFWDPNDELAPLQSSADALYAKVPDFGGYLLKIGSESQAGKPSPDYINRVAATLIRNPSSGQSNGIVAVRGFIYGSHRYKYKNRMSVPAHFFGRYDGQYSDNVYILGKFSALDYETSEPINALDGKLKKSRYGTDVVVGKYFLMSWAKRYEKWLEFDTFRGPNGSSLLNRETTQAFLGTSMGIGARPSWTGNPLNMVNYYAFGRMSWDMTLTAETVHDEWIKQTFGLNPTIISAVESILNISERAADLLGLYHGYRGVWYKWQKGTNPPELRSSPVNHQTLTSKGIGMPKDAADELMKEFSEGVQKIYRNYTDPRSEESLLEWATFPLHYRLTNGRTIIEDMMARPREGVNATFQMLEAWKQPAVEAAVKAAAKGNYWEAVAQDLQLFVDQARLQNNLLQYALKKLSGGHTRQQYTYHGTPTLEASSDGYDAYARNSEYIVI